MTINSVIKLNITVTFNGITEYASEIRFNDIRFNGIANNGPLMFLNNMFA